MNKTKMNSFSIALLLFVAVFGLTNIPNNYASLGNSAIGWFILLGVYFIPLALIIGELSSQNTESKSGIFGWVNLGLSEKWAFIASWSYFVVNIFYLPMLASRIPLYIAWTFSPVKYDLDQIVADGGHVAGILNASDDQALFLGLTFLALIVTLILGLYFEKFFSKGAKLIGWLSLFVTGLFIVMAFGCVLINGTSIANPVTLSSVTPHVDFTSLSTFAWIVFAIAGIETISNYTPLVKDPDKTIPKASISAAVLVIGAYVIGFIALAFVLTPGQVPLESMENILMIMYSQVGSVFGLGGLFLRLITFSYLLISFTAVVLWLNATVKTLFEEFPEGIISEKISKYKINDAPIFGLLVTMFLILVLMIMSSVGQFSNVYYTLYDMTTVAVLLPYVLITIGFIAFCMKKDIKLNVIKSKSAGIVMSVFILVITVIAMVFSIFDLSIGIGPDFFNWALTSGGGLLYFMLVGVAIYSIKLNKKIGIVATIIIFILPLFLFLI